MCKSTPLKALKTRYFSNYQKLLPIACLSLFINKKDPDGLYFYRTIKVILYSKLHFMFSHDFFHFTG